MEYVSSGLTLPHVSLDFVLPGLKRLGQGFYDHFIPHHRNNYHPQILGHRVLGLFSLLLMTVKIATIATIALGPVAPALSSAITPTNIISLTNDARIAAGLSTLSSNSLLTKAAQNKANDMLARQYFSHNTPDGKTPWTFIQAVGYSYITAGENLAVDFTEAENVQSAWMNSPGHKANILNKSFEEIGIGIASGMFEGHQSTIVVQMFGAPIAQKVTTQTAPTPVAQPAPAPAPAPATTTAPKTTAPKSVPTPPPTKVAAAQAVPAPAPTAQPTSSPAAPQPVKILDAETRLQDDKLFVSVTASESATKILASYGEGSIMFDPVSSTEWQGVIPLWGLVAGETIIVKAFDIRGETEVKPLVSFSESMQDAIHPASADNKELSVEVLGNRFNTTQAEKKIYLVAMAGLLSCLVLAVGIKRHIQHVSLVANTSFVAMLAAILFMI
jgi:cell division septation protein DedD